VEDDKVDACSGALEMLNPRTKSCGMFEVTRQKAEQPLAERQGRARGEITDPLSSFVSLPYGYPATACVGIKPEKPKSPA
jgi:hypothetical protein